MSEFSLLCDNVDLWDHATKATWGSLDFCSRIRAVYGTHPNSYSANQPLQSRDLGGHWETTAWHSLIDDSTEHQHWGHTGFWPSSCMGPSSPSSLDHTGRSSPQTGTTHGQWPGLALCLCLHEQYNSPHALIRMQDTLAPWLMVDRVSMHVAIYTNSKNGNCYNTRNM